MFKKTILFSFFTLFLISAFSFADDNVAVILKTIRDVKVTPTNQVKTVQGKRGYVLEDGNKITTGTRSFCAVKFLDDKSLLRIRQNSSCVIEGKKEDNKIDKNIFVEVGSFFASLFKPKGSFKVTTPTSVASVKGTEFWVIQESPTKYIVTKDGPLEVENETNKVLVKEGQTAVVESKTSEIRVYLTRDGEIPTDDDGQTSIKDLDIGFENDKGEEKILRIKVQE